MSLGDRKRDFFTNWNESEMPLVKKLAVTIRNRFAATGMGRSCCGHPGQPGC